MGDFFKRLWATKKLPIVLFITILGSIITYSEPINHMIMHEHSYNTEKLKKDSGSLAYFAHTYSDDGEMLSSFYTYGINLDAQPVGNIVDGHKSQLDAVTIRASHHELLLTGSPTVIYDTRLHNEALRSIKIPHNEPYINTMIAKTKKHYQYASKILVIKTYREKPVALFYGNVIKEYYTNIDSSEVFTVDNDLVFVYRGEFAIIDVDLLK
ncbi:DUF5052 family protein [Lactobacillus amylolyticus]|uniref:DUF5052 family protein n=1 Tax=Lactobacillus amylolyticus TaxID=83683 RepID=UPI002492B37A|nr:DUF5052 family protein [Lactobacillus amylolyticus]